MPDNTFANVPGMKNAAAVPDVNAGAITEAVFKAEYVANSRPCIIRGAVKHWPALKKWRDKEYLKRRSGRRGVYLYQSENHITGKRLLPRQKAVTFADAVDYLHSEHTKIGIVPTETLAEFLSDLGDIAVLGKTEPAFWYPPARYFFYRNAGTTWHYHPFDETLTCQLIGRKKIGLVSSDPPFDHELLNIFFAEDYYDNPRAFEGFDCGKLRWFSATLEEGDALYIPPLWWHGVVPLTTTFGATAAMTWRSPLPVIAKGITQLAHGDVYMLGKTIAPHFHALVEVARQMGLERELKIAWDRGV